MESVSISDEGSEKGMRQLHLSFFLFFFSFGSGFTLAHAVLMLCSSFLSTCADFDCELMMIFSNLPSHGFHAEVILLSNDILLLRVEKAKTTLTCLQSPMNIVVFTTCKYVIINSPYGLVKL